MTLDEIKVKADLFFEFPTEKRDHVTTTSAMLFARHILEFAGMEHQEGIAWAERFAATRCAEIAGSQDAIGKTPAEVAAAIRREFRLEM